MKRTILAILAACGAMAAHPAWAKPPQLILVPDTDIEAPAEEAAEEDFSELFDEMDLFKVEVPDFTPEQEARLPAAKRVAWQLMPEGSFADMMDGIVDPIMEPLMMEIEGDPRASLSELTGLPESRFRVVPDANVEAAVAMLDPDRAARSAAFVDVMRIMMAELGQAFEPFYRDGMARALAVQFTQEDLDDLETFFATPVGERFASQQMALYGSPHVMNAYSQMGPAMGAIFPEMVDRMAALEEQFPVARSVAELSPTERVAFAELLGMTEDELTDEAIDPDDPDAQDPLPEDTIIET